MAHEQASSFLFHHPKFIFRNPGDSIILFENQRAKIYFAQIGNALISLDRSPFGSFVLDEGATKDDLTDLLESVTSWAISHQVSNLIIRSFPNAYHEHHSILIQNAVLNGGFVVKYDDITQLISIDEGMNLDTHKRRRLRKAEASEFAFQLLSSAYLEESYSLIVESRENKSYPVTMTLKDIKAMFQLFPDQYLLFGVFDKNKMIATSVSIKVNSDILYCFYIGDHLAYRAYSPVTSLINGIYQYCQIHHFRLLDLGLSTDKGELNQGLYTFKKSFGTFDSHKLTYLKQF